MKLKNLFSFSAITLVIALAMLSITSCKKDDDNSTPALSITSITPSSGVSGDQVTIIGSSFDATSSKNLVKFGTVEATIVTASTTALIVTVPAGLSKGAVDVSVTVNGKTATSPTQFTVTDKPTVTISANITADATWTSDKVYLLSGKISVKSPAKLTIQPGTIVKGDKITQGTLIIESGAQIIAVGTASQPIIFTSNVAKGLRNLGDWGGLVLIGKADHNLATGVSDTAKLPQVEGLSYAIRVSAIDGSRNNADNSGKLQYVRIEYGGVALSPNNEINGLSMYAVGSGTTIDHVQVSFANDDSFEWFGGTVNMKNIIAWRGIDDDFDTDNGFSGNLQYGLGVRDLTIADQSGSKGFESDNNNTSNLTELPQTSAVFSNFTLVGPTAVGSDQKIAATIINPLVGSATSPSSPSANYTAGIHLRRNTSISVFNSIIMGWPCGVLIDKQQTLNNAINGNLLVKNNIISGVYLGTVNGVGSQNRDLLYLRAKGDGSVVPAGFTPGFNTSDTTDFGANVGPFTWWSAQNNKRFKSTNDVSLTSIFDSKTAINAVPKAGSPALGFADYSNAKFSDFFDKTKTTIGAVSSDNTWTTESWINFDPQNTDY